PGAAVSADPSYNGCNAGDVPDTTLDNETAGISVTPASGLNTTESGGTATFTVVLTQQPTGIVTVPLASSDTTEGTISTNALAFKIGRASCRERVKVMGSNDATKDGTVGDASARVAGDSA